MAASALIPARISSVFLMGVLSLAARSFNSSSTAYSALGIVRLSRINFGFFSLTDLTSVALAFALDVVVAEAVVLVATLAAGILAAGALRAGLTIALTGTTRWGAGFAAGWAVTGVDFSVVDIFKDLFLNGVNSLYRFYSFVQLLQVIFMGVRYQYFDFNGNPKKCRHVANEMNHLQLPRASPWINR
jgi:hypothetical protein